MSFTITYKKLFVVRVKENGTNLPIRFFRFQPTVNCQKLLHDYQLVFRNRENGFDIYYRSYSEASETIPAPISEKIRFSFGLKITDYSALGQYEPASAQLPQLYLANLSSDGSITPGHNLTATSVLGAGDLASLKQQTFWQKTELPGGSEPNEWRLKDKYGLHQILQTVPIVVPTNPPMPSIDVKLNDPVLHKAEYLTNEGPYILESDQPVPAPITVYLSNTITQKNWNGVIDIYWNSIQSDAPADTGKEYQIILKLK